MDLPGPQGSLLLLGLEIYSIYWGKLLYLEYTNKMSIGNFLAV